MTVAGRHVRSGQVTVHGKSHQDAIYNLTDNLCRQVDKVVNKIYKIRDSPSSIALSFVQDHFASSMVVALNLSQCFLVCSLALPYYSPSVHSMIR